MLKRAPKSSVVAGSLLLMFGMGVFTAPTSGQSRQMVPEGETAGSTSAPASEPAPEAAAQSEFCEVLHRFNADKKIADPKIRDRFAGEYGRADDADRLQTWNVETSCGEFLVAVPLWADVSPPVLALKGDNLFEDSMGGTWLFQVDGESVVTGVVMTAADGSVSTMTRVGAPRHWGDPHENLNGKHLKDWSKK